MINELILDFNALNKVESLPWDEVRFTERGYDRLTAQELSLLDEMAEVIVAGASFQRIRDLFKSNSELRKMD